MDLKYQIEDKLAWKESLLYGLQWLAISLPAVVTIGKVLGGAGSPAAEVLYLQKLLAVTGAILVIQILWGHRLPIVIGPATVLLIGILASAGSSSAAIYTSLAVGGLLLALLAVTGLFGRLQSLFTPRVVAVILLLVAFTLTPTILNLLTAGSEPSPDRRLAFALVFMLLMFVGGHYIKGFFKNILILVAMVLGSLAYFLVDPGWASGASLGEISMISGFWTGLNLSPSLQPGLLVAFLLCYIFGIFGAHRFYADKIGTGVIWLLTFGAFGIGYIVDLIMIILGYFQDKDGAYIKNWFN